MGRYNKTSPLLGVDNVSSHQHEYTFELVGNQSLQQRKCYSRRPVMLKARNIAFETLREQRTNNSAYLSINLCLISTSTKRANIINITFSHRFHSINYYSTYVRLSETTELLLLNCKYYHSNPCYMFTKNGCNILVFNTFGQ